MVGYIGNFNQASLCFFSFNRRERGEGVGCLALYPSHTMIGGKVVTGKLVIDHWCNKLHVFFKKIMTSRDVTKTSCLDFNGDHIF